MHLYQIALAQEIEILYYPSYYQLLQAACNTIEKPLQKGVRVEVNFFETEKKFMQKKRTFEEVKVRYFTNYIYR